MAALLLLLLHENYKYLENFSFKCANIDTAVGCLGLLPLPVPETGSFP